MYRRPVVVRRGPGLLSAVAVGADPQRRARPAPALSSEDRIGQLQDLGELKASGVLTDDEFLREKRRVLGAG